MGSFFLIFNAVMNYDHLDAGRPASAPATSGTSASGEEQEEQD
jgi:hypothetical protein